MRAVHLAEAAAAADSLYAIGYEMYAVDRWRDAADVFRAMVLLWPLDERGWLGLGRCHDSVGEQPVALELLSLATVAIPRSVRARLALAGILRDQARHDDADRLVDDAERLANDADQDDLLELVIAARRRTS
jgi:tetratricopeptide (TPR) repeat protein